MDSNSRVTEKTGHKNDRQTSDTIKRFAIGATKNLRQIFVLQTKLTANIIFTNNGIITQKKLCEKNWPKKTGTLCFVRLNFAKYWPIFTLNHCQNQENNCNNSFTDDPTTPQVCRYTTLWNVSVLKVIVEHKTTSVTTHFKSASSSSKADSLNIWCKNCRMRQLL